MNITPLRIIVGFSPGSASDDIANLIAAPLAAQLGRQVVIERIAGESGTLRHRMRSTTAQTNLHAKTGTTNDVVALAGYVTARNGELLAFCMLYNGRDRWRAREAIDAIGITLANWSR